MRLIHYSIEPVAAVRSTPQKPDDYSPKPWGLWVSVKGDDDWERWCRSENFNIAALDNPHSVSLVRGANILHLKSAAEIDDFTAEYARPADLPWNVNRSIAWERVAEKHQGIIIAPYQWGRRIDGNAAWYYGWDCASGCIWDAAAVASIAPISAKQEAA